jgi:hypothetical protein
MAVTNTVPSAQARRREIITTPLHLRDCIAATIGTDKASVEKIVRRLDEDVIFPSPELSACCDVANGSKHLN